MFGEDVKDINHLKEKETKRGGTLTKKLRPVIKKKNGLAVGGKEKRPLSQPQ